MVLSRLHFRGAAWLAALAVFAAAVVPTVAHLLARAGGPETLLICSAAESGGQRNPAAPGQPTKSAAWHGDCAYCTTHLPLTGVGMPGPAWVPPPQASVTVAVAPAPALRDAAPYPRAHSRAPPVLA